MRTILLGLAVVAPAVLVTPALAQDNPTFGRVMANVLGIQPDPFCTNLNNQDRARYVALRYQPRLRISGRFAGEVRYEYGQNFGAYIPDIDGDNVADYGSSSSSYGSSSSSYGSSSSSYGSSSSSSGPLEYVRVADTFGSGFYYIPGTETCLRIGGYVRFQSALDIGGGLFGTVGTRAGVSIDTRTQTPFGTLRTYAMLNKFAGVNFGGGSASLDFDHWFDRAFIQIAGFNVGQRQMTVTAGRLSSAFDAGPGYTYYSGPQSDVTLLQLRGSWQLHNGLAVDLALERQEERGIYGDVPVALVAGFGPADGMPWRASTALFSTPYGPGLAGQFSAGFDFSPKFSARVTAALSLNGPSYVGLYGADQGLFWGGNISGRYQTPTPIYLVGLFGAAGGGGNFEWETTVGVGRELGPNSMIGAEITRWGNGMGGGEWGALLRYQRTFRH